MGRKTPVLRKGLTVEKLLAGTWMSSKSRYKGDHEISAITDGLLRAALQDLINVANQGERVNSKVVSSTLCNLADMLKTAKDHICVGLRNGELTPDILDELANI